jgi:hypothetical protein
MEKAVNKVVRLTDDELERRIWSEPAPALPQSAEPAWPTMDGAAYHGFAGEVVETIEPHSEADPVAILLQFLTCVGNVIGRTAYYQVESDRHHANLFTVLVGATLTTLESRCPELVVPERWQQTVVDAQRFLARWDEQAHALGWTAKDLFGLQTPPEKPHPSYSRLSRYDEIGLIWLLRGREVVALTEATAAIQNPTGAITIYRRHNKPALGPIGDSLDDLEPPFGAA